MKRFVVLCALMLACQGCVFANLDLAPKRKPYQEKTVRLGTGTKIALIDITGTITSEVPAAPLLGGQPESMMTRVVDQIRIASNDPNVGAIVLKIDSPGGSVTASDIIHREITLAKKRGKKVVAALMDIAASGGVYIAVAADRIIAHPTTVTGSIGVIMRSFDVSGLMAKVGVKAAAIKSSDKKDIGSPFRPMTAPERKILQDVIDEMYSQFLTKVHEGRPKMSMKVLRRIADGRIFTATKAREYGLIDGIGYLDQTFTLAAGLADSADPTIIRYHRENEPVNGIYASSAVKLQARGIIAQEIEAVVGPLRKSGFYYYWAP